jgi:hypothetical protein
MEKGGERNTTPSDSIANEYFGIRPIVARITKHIMQAFAIAVFDINIPPQMG